MQNYPIKSYEAFRTGKGVCYEPELSDAQYTRADFLRLANGDVGVAERLFDLCDWQHPETLLLEDERDHAIFPEDD